MITLFTGKRKISGFKWPQKREMRQSSFQRKRFLYNGKGLVEWGKLREENKDLTSIRELGMS